MEHNPPVASRVRGQISMAQSLKFPKPGIHIAVGQNWVPGQLSKGPQGLQDRAMVSMCPYSVPPSAIIR